MSRLKRESTSISIAEFYENHVLGKYNYDPAYQRKSIWTDEKRSFLIDSILKNFPIPPVFLHQKIDEDTGKTHYDVIDGKQRLTSLTKFINNELSVTSELNENDALAGVYFKELDGSLSDYKKDFWRYRIPLELIDSSDIKLIDEIFDRLNRNGEKLNGQELRKAKYYGTALLNLVEKIANTNSFWANRLSSATDLSRMEDQEFISELLFVLSEDKLFGSNQETLDSKYEKYSQKDSAWADSMEQQFLEATRLLESLNLDYDLYKVGGVSHLFGLWSFTVDRITKNKIQDLASKIESFYRTLRDAPYTNSFVSDYKKSMSSGTKEVTQRNRRRQSLIGYVESF